MPSLRTSVERLLSTVSVSQRTGPAGAHSTSGVVSSGNSFGAHPPFPERFRVQEKLGEGGMGVVYRAYDSELASDIALKSLSRVSAHDLYHLKREFRALADIRHPNLIDLYELFADGQTCFFTMELIAGTDLVEYLRHGSDAVDEDHFRDAARQLALAVAAVHSAKRLHRDIKPSNVMVTQTGRVVLLDFGLVVALSQDGAFSEWSSFAGTRGYMSPEQLRGESVLTTAIDWYMVGASLFEAATGRRAYETPLKALSEGHDVPRVRQTVPSFPADLDQLIADLIHPVAARRPDGNDVLRRLGVGATSTTSSGRNSPVPPMPNAFEGRRSELERLESALADSRTGKTVVVRVHGPSGIGKSELAKRFVEHVSRDGAVVLKGRCHPQETVAFNALDGAIDDLSRILEAMRHDEVAPLVPAQPEALTRIFPVLERVDAIAAATADADASIGAEAFRRAARALKQLLVALGQRQPLVLWIDDAQWSDEGSGALIKELLSAPEAPAMLLLITYRSEEHTADAPLAVLDAPGARTAVETIDMPLGPLSEEETLALIGRLIAEDVAAGETRLEHLARETRGSPFFIQELARFISAAPSADAKMPSHVQLGDLLQARMQGLTAAARGILEVVSVAGGPLEQQVLLRAAGVGDAVRLTLQTLERECLIRTVAIEADRRTEVYHHRLRDEVLRGLTDEGRRVHHRAIADAMLTAERPKLSGVVEHYEAAGDLAAVRRYVLAAAKHAADALALDLAAKLYRRAIAIGGVELGEAELRARLGEVLASAGRGLAAGDEFERAAELASTELATSERPRDGRIPYLRQRAAEQYLESGHRDKAAHTLDSVLSRLGLKLPKTRNAALARVLANRCIVLARGLDYERRDPSEIPTEVLDRLDFLQVMMMTAGLIDLNTGAWLASRLFLEALRVGEASRIAVALSNECAVWSPLPGRLSRRQVDRMHALLKKLCSESELPLHQAGYHHCTGLVTWFRGDLVQAFENLDRAKTLYEAIRAGVSLHIVNVEAFRLPVLAMLGRIRELREELDAAVRDADDRGDELLATTCTIGEPSIAWLADDRPAEALRWAERALRAAPSGFSTPHYLHLITCANVALYQGDGIVACEQVEAAWPALERNLLLSMAWTRDELAQLRGRAAIAAAEAMQREGKASPRPGHGAKDWLALALRQARILEKNAYPFAQAWAHLLRAGVAASNGDRLESIRLLRAAAPEFRIVSLLLYHHTALYCLGRCSSDPDDMARADASERWLRDEGVRHPARLCAALAPGLLDLPLPPP
jgi:tetratricopeptide (TPR) repeat protein